MSNTGSTDGLPRSPYNGAIISYTNSKLTVASSFRRKCSCHPHPLYHRTTPNAICQQTQNGQSAPGDSQSALSGFRRSDLREIVYENLFFPTKSPPVRLSVYARGSSTSTKQGGQRAFAAGVWAFICSFGNVANPPTLTKESALPATLPRVQTDNYSRLKIVTHFRGLSATILVLRHGSENLMEKIKEAYDERLHNDPRTDSLLRGNAPY